MKVLAKEMKKTPRAIEIKLKRPGVVVEKRAALRTTTTEVKSKSLLSREQALKPLRFFGLSFSFVLLFCFLRQFPCFMRVTSA